MLKFFTDHAFVEQTKAYRNKQHPFEVLSFNHKVS